MVPEGRVGTGTGDYVIYSRLRHEPFLHLPDEGVGLFDVAPLGHTDEDGYFFPVPRREKLDRGKGDEA